MRQLFTWGFWMSLVALIAVTFVLRTYTNTDPVVTLAIQPTVIEREVDVIELVYVAEADPGFQIIDGRTTANMQIRIDGFRYLNIRADTPGENRCELLTEVARCAVVADLLGEAVLWFAIVPLEPRNVVNLPPIREIRDGQRVRLDNGWVLRRADTVTRVCDTDTASLSEFIRTHGDGSTTTFSLATQVVTTVTCAAGQAA